MSPKRRRGGRGYQVNRLQPSRQRRNVLLHRLTVHVRELEAVRGIHHLSVIATGALHFHQSSGM